MKKILCLLLVTLTYNQAFSEVVAIHYSDEAVSNAQKEALGQDDDDDAKKKVILDLAVKNCGLSHIESSLNVQNLTFGDNETGPNAEVRRGKEIGSWEDSYVFPVELPSKAIFLQAFHMTNDERDTVIVISKVTADTRGEIVAEDKQLLGELTNFGSGQSLLICVDAAAEYSVAAAGTLSKEKRTGEKFIADWLGVPGHAPRLQVYSVGASSLEVAP